MESPAKKSLTESEITEAVVERWKARLLMQKSNRQLEDHSEGTKSIPVAQKVTYQKNKFQALSLEDIEMSLESIYQKNATVQDKKNNYTFMLSPLPFVPPPPIFFQDTDGNVVKVQDEVGKNI